MSGVNGAIAVAAPGGIAIQCVTPDSFGCMVPRHTYTITLSWTVVGPGAACHWDWYFGTRIDEYTCTDITVSDTVTRTVVAGNPGTTTSTSLPPQNPVSAFRFTQSATDPFSFAFESAATDYEDDPSQLEYHWDFDDGHTSAERSPSHRFEHAGAYAVTLTVTDASGRQHAFTQEVVVANPMVVNSTADGAAVDPSLRGCDTGLMVGDDPECTLRAALETAEVRGGGDISFAIDTGGIPSIVTTSPLPTTNTNITIDGTTQPGGWVAIRSAGLVGLQADNGTLNVSGLALSGQETSVALVGGTGHHIEGNRLGTDASGTAPSGQTGYGAIVVAPDVTIEKNVIASAAGVASRGADTKVLDNDIGVAESGTPFGGAAVGVLALGGNAEVSGNVIIGDVAAVAAIGPASSGISVTDNRIGVSRSGSTVDGVGMGVFVDGSPGAAIVGNRLRVDGGAAIVVTGTQQSTIDEQDNLNVWLPTDPTNPGTVTGGHAAIADNTIDEHNSSSYGIASLVGAEDVSISDNTVIGATSAAVKARGGADLRVTGNVLGSDAHPVASAISVEAVDDVTIGGDGDSHNTIIATNGGVSVDGPAAAVRVAGNSLVGGTGSANLTAIRIGENVDGAVVSANQTVGGRIGIASVSDGARVDANSISGAAGVGIDATGDSVVVDSNVVVRSGIGITAGGDPVTVTRNRVGVDAEGTVAGNTGSGIAIHAGAAKVERNIVAGSGEAGIVVAEAATGDLRANRVWSSGGPALSTGSDPAAPVLTGVIREGSGNDSRTILLVNEVPDVGGGRVEVFANDDCDDPEAKYLMEPTRSTRPGQTQRAIVLRGAASRDHFTVNYTTPDGSTSDLSNCSAVAPQADDDGDGSENLIDGIGGFEDDPTAAVIVTDDEKLALLWAIGGGYLENVGVRNDPTPGSHPAGWKLAYGALGFRVAGLAAGGSTQVVVAPLEGTQVEGTSYWKYGAASQGAAPSWYSFEPDAQTRTGASLETTMVAGALRRVWILELVDGGRGDSDGGANRTITDPGGPVIGAPEPEPEPPATTATTSTPTSPSTSAPASTSPSAPTPTSPTTVSTTQPTGSTSRRPAGAAPATTSSGTVAGRQETNGAIRSTTGATGPTTAKTGSETARPIMAAGVLLILGLVAVATSSRTSPRNRRRTMR